MTLIDLDFPTSAVSSRQTRPTPKCQREHAERVPTNMLLCFQVVSDPGTRPTRTHPVRSYLPVGKTCHVFPMTCARKDSNFRPYIESRVTRVRSAGDSSWKTV